jgi:hypothetical protein
VQCSCNCSRSSRSSVVGHQYQYQRLSNGPGGKLSDNASSSIDFNGTPFLPFAKGQAKVENKKGVITIQAELEKMSPANTLGPEFLTYVLWAITPEGRARNLGEFQLNGDKSKLTVTTQLPNFAMIVTAEPYFAVSYASEEVVLHGVPSSDTKGQITPVTAQLLSRSTYHESQLQPFTIDPKIPLIVYEARNALRIAQLQGAEKYAVNAWASAQQTQAQMEDYIARKQKNPILTAARSATQQAEDARSIAVKAEADEKVAEAKSAEAARISAADQREAQLKAEQAAEAQRSAEAEALRPKRPRPVRRRTPPENKPKKQLKSRPQRLLRRWRRSGSCGHNF